MQTVQELDPHHDEYTFQCSRSYVYRLRPLKGHERSYGSCKMNRMYLCTELNLRM